MGYEIVDVGFLQSSRGIGVLLAMFISNRIAGIVNVRIQIAFGLTCLGTSSLTIAFWTSDVGVWPILWTGFVSGIGSGILMVPAQLVAFSRVVAAKRNEGAAVFNLIRTMFSSVGVSLMLAIFIYAGATGRSELVEHVNVFNDALTNTPVASEGYSLETLNSLAVLEKEVDRQSQLQGYIASFFVLAIASFMAIPIVFLIRRVDIKRRGTRKGSSQGPPVGAE